MPEPVQPPVPKPQEPQSDAGHVPITEEFDSAKWTLPPIVPVLIALGVVAVVVAVLSFANRQKPAASGEITDVQAMETSGTPNVLVAINLKVHNTTDRKIYIKTLYGVLTLPDKAEPLEDESASAVDYDRYYKGYPPLQQNAIDALKPETIIPAGSDAAGRVIVSFPISQADFDKRKSLGVRLVLYDQNPITITK
jgi:hypothetical protein